MNKIITDTDCVFHLAALVSVPESLLKLNECIEINTIGTLNVLEAARKNDNMVGENLQLTTAKSQNACRRRNTGTSAVLQNVVMQWFLEPGSEEPRVVRGKCIRKELD